MGLRSKLYEFKNRLTVIKQPKNTGEIIKYDADNKFPQNLIASLSQSGTATACIEALNQYAYAEGFVDETLANTKVNEKQTFNEIYADSLQQAIYFEGCAIHVSRNTSGVIIAIKAIPFENVRRAENYLVYNPTYNDSYNSAKDVKYPYFKGAKITADELAEISLYRSEKGETLGEILYYFKPKPNQYIYPIPPYYSAISDIDTDAENSKYELESVNNSFLPSGILSLVGEVDDENKDENNNTEWDDLKESLAGFTGNSKDSKGESGRQKLLVLHAKTKEELPNYTPINNEGILTAIETSTKRVSEKVARAFGVPPFIIGLGGNVGFATNIISDNITLFNNRILRTQKIATGALSLCFPELNFETTLLNPIKFIDPLILNDLTTAERRELYGYKTDVTKATSNVSLAQTLGVGGTQSLISVIQDGVLTPEQKINTLQVLFNVSLENANKLINGNV